ncbi:MAG: GlsB/YeaQ/YmgE family stress response membrane protein [Devosia sp.]|uniref:GlsB/YeaQ/YmgE family stress response membrane protein n=1 Tax=Devosia sp. TaxID=1871048 RepID=UPI001ACB9D3F|nr:GlsB/YeaQ/YmgE family stress response membrane protein [Devosia sp.]MBN9309365.1 GlsB/YeaQ/YmgE family stress response membrane protein [Devosia sp.]MBN9316503.1 GlsB/YeaQ/YmgE family stress response membrane protein [Devosia sp.]
MDLTSILIVLIVGAVAGWLAGVIMKGSGFGLVGDIIIGLVGGLIAGWLLPMVGVSFGGLIGSIIMSVIGAVILIFIIRLVRRAT